MSVFPVRIFDENHAVFTEGSRGDIAYILKKGSVEVSLKVGDKKIVLAKLKAPGVFGEMALLLREHKRTATVTTTEKCEVVEIHRHAFDEYIEKSPPVIATVLTVLASRLQETTGRAAKAPDIFRGMCEILNLLANYAESDFPYEETTQAISSALVVPAKEIKELLAMMAEFHLIVLSYNKGEEKVIRLLDRDRFLQRAERIHTTLRTFKVDQEDSST